MRPINLVKALVRDPVIAVGNLRNGVASATWHGPRDWGDKWHRPFSSRPWRYRSDTKTVYWHFEQDMNDPEAVASVENLIRRKGYTVDHHVEMRGHHAFVAHGEDPERARELAKNFGWK